jgi:membrane fusion protein, multidrug efflux system
MFRSPIVAALILLTVAGCERPPPPPAPARPVRTVTVERHTEGELASLTGQVRAKDQANLSFRLDGRMTERAVRIGDTVTEGQVVARVESSDQQNAVKSAKGRLSSAQAALTQARLTYGRQEELLKSGWTSRARFDEAEQSFLSAQAQVDSARADLRLAEDRLGYTVLLADGPGVVTAVGAEPGEVVRAGQMVAQIARQGGLDAVFDAPEQLVRTGPRDPAVEIALSDDQRIKASGRIREVAPQADSATRTFQVKVGIIDPPETMRLGSTVTGRIRLVAAAGVEIPATALTQSNGRPAVWVVDRRSQTVSLRNVDVERYEAASALVAQGLDAGDLVVTAGVQTLRPDQKVRLLGGSL